MKVTKNKSLAEKIADILTAAPATANLDPEDEIDETRAKLNDDVVEVEGDDNEEKLLSKFRRKNIDLLADVDERYAGRKGSRNTLANFQESSESEDSETDVRLEKEDDENEHSQDLSDENEEDDEISHNDTNSEDDGSDTEDVNNFQHIKETDVSSQVKKGWCVRNQLSMWENLLEMRIQIQKCLIAANKMPQREKFTDIKRQCGQEFVNKVNETKNNISSVLDKLLLLQNLVLKKFPETKNIGKIKENSEDSNEEEILSDTDDEFNKEDGDRIDEIPSKKRKFSEFEKEISSQHDIYRNYRNEIIQKWHEKTQIAIINNSNSHSIINHIEHTLSDRSKLIKRTQLKRSDYKIVGEETNKDNFEKLENIEQKTLEYNSEIFDDDDFYHQLLRELIEMKSADLTDPVQLGRQWIQLQNLRSKMKRKVDTRATKGRKIRYAVHTKLVNFMAPIDENLWTDDAKTELYSSLFGKNQRVIAS